tara:strand:+ start:285 stop:587 length:303 start_codon:yes stop_codon:yes gene_type:complete
MNYKDIKTHSERCESHPDHQWGRITNQTITNLLLDEIAQLRDYIDAQINKYPVYTTRSELKPLTDKDIEKLMVRTWGFAPQSVPEFARAIERAHGIRGEE